MNYFEAHEILDGIKDNLSYNLDTINKALELTGDLDGFQPNIRATSGTADKDGFTKGLGCLRKEKSAGT
jgi:arginase family enzyme